MHSTHPMPHLPRLSPRWRLVALCLVSLALHVLVLRGIHLPAPVDESTERLSATLVPLPPPPAAQPPASAPVAVIPRGLLHPLPHLPPLAPPAPLVAVTDVAPLAVPTTAGEGTAAGAAAGAATGSGSAGVGAASTGEATPAPLSSPPLTGQAAASARLEYDVVAKDPRKDPRQSLVGNGTIDWKLDGSHYAATLKATASLLFLKITVLESESQGSIDPYGLAPERYSETPRNRGALVTLFRRGQDTVGVGATDLATVQEGAQDRLSIVLQIGALLRANPDLTRAGSHFEIPVANLKGETTLWTFTVLGLEPVETGIGRIDGVHVQRVLRPGSNDRRIDLWMAMDLGGYPARILYTEPSDAFIDLTLSRVQ